jgi:hypothetical protein
MVTGGEGARDSCEDMPSHARSLFLRAKSEDRYRTLVPFAAFVSYNTPVHPSAIKRYEVLSRPKHVSSVLHTSSLSPSPKLTFSNSEPDHLPKPHDAFEDPVNTSKDPRHHADEAAAGWLLASDTRRMGLEEVKERLKNDGQLNQQQPDEEGHGDSYAVVHTSREPDQL